MMWRLGIDLGTNSLGWAALALEDRDGSLVPCGLLDCGSRIFSDGRNPKDKQSNAATRRGPRGARKNRDRYKRRRDRLMRQLVQFALMPEDPVARKNLEGGKGVALADSDPWILRARALDEAVAPYQFGRAIFHLHQRRGFKSNRKTDRGDNERGKVHEAIDRTRKKLKEAGARTVGELFGRPRLEVVAENRRTEKGQRRPQPLARVRKSGDGAKWQYDHYPTRELVLDEFDRLWTAQKRHHPGILTDDAYAALRDTIEWQHPLKEPPVGKCTLMPEEPRAPKALPSFQRSRIFQEVNALRIAPVGKAPYPLAREERDLIVARLLNPTNKNARLTFDQIRRIKGVSIYDGFNTETETRSFLQGDETAARLMQEERWGAGWLELDLAARDEIVMRLLDEEDEEKLVDWLCETHGLAREQAYRVADCPLPEGYGSLSQVALSRLLPVLEADVIVYSDAVTEAGFASHSQFATGEVFDKGLPYYGIVLERHVAFGSGEPGDPDEKRYGRLANPTVHVALNQLRAVVNDLIRRFGAPEEIVLELARELPLSAKGIGELNSKQRDNWAANEKRRKTLEEKGVPDSYDNRLRLRLYEELEALGKRCVFSGEQIGLHNLFSPEVEIEHILPYSRTFDDSFSNKTLATRQANRDKKNRTPYEAFGHSPAGYDWEEISKRAAELPPNKRWRFSPDAMERYEKEGGFIARQLTDTQYIARLAKAYVEAIYGGQGYEGSRNRVWAVVGRLTSDLRWQWGLDSILHGHNLEISEAQKKNREDHRHHAIDAVVVGCTDRAMLKKASDEAQQNEERWSERLLVGTPEPWDGFRTDVAERIHSIVVSHKPDHGYQDAMHNDTAYGLPKGKEGEPDKKGVRKAVVRKPLESFEKPEDLEKIREFDLKLKLLQATEGLSGKAFKEALLAYASAMRPPVYRVRIEENLKLIAMKDKTGREYKAYKGDGNYCYDIWLGEKGKWDGEVISTFDAYRLAQEDGDWWKKTLGRTGRPLLMRLRKNDYLQIEHDNKEMIVQIVKFSTGMIALVEHFEANADARTRDKTSGFKYIFKSPSSLQKAAAKRVTVSPSGVVNTYG